jgi:hypothetical protein
MGDTWFYRFIFVAFVILGIVFPETIPLSLRIVLVRGGVAGLMFDERISKERPELERQRPLLEPNQLTGPQQGQNTEAFCRDLSLPSEPDEGY